MNFQKTVQEVSDFLAWVPQVRQAFEFDDHEPFGPWFRGHQREHWPLCPTLYREFGGKQRIFAGDNEEMLWVDEKDVPRSPGPARRLYEDFGVLMDHRYGCPKNFNPTKQQ